MRDALLVLVLAGLNVVFFAPPVISREINVGYVFTPGVARYEECISYLVFGACKDYSSVVIPPQIYKGETININVNGRMVSFAVRSLRARGDGLCWATTDRRTQLGTDTLYISGCRH
jgi:hypothetical protein